MKLHMLPDVFIDLIAVPANNSYIFDLTLSGIIIL